MRRAAPRLPQLRSTSVVPALYRSARRAARLCDSNPGLRRHLLTRLVRDSVYIDDIATNEDVRRCDADDFSLVRPARRTAPHRGTVQLAARSYRCGQVRSVTAHFRREQQKAEGQEVVEKKRAVGSPVYILSAHQGLVG
jgi:hypothetical protein